ncbi:SCP2 sterol-binding domain-containing protein [Roseomonas sp. CCTCC AB2023176]|uniref:SCP2 sterol-binding domain-containing protein n=1 Tax=Roseomonas sp. CCTCC AB2023176 TaxID=3342640 RepID=UPI0035E04BAC
MPDRDELMTQMRARGAALRSLGYRVRFDLTDTDQSILLDAAGGNMELHEAGPAEEADTVLALTSNNLAKLIAGKLSPMLAFSTGKLRVEGSKGVAMKLASLLDED